MRSSRVFDRNFVLFVHSKSSLRPHGALLAQKMPNRAQRPGQVRGEGKLGGLSKIRHNTERPRAEEGHVPCPGRVQRKSVLENAGTRGLYTKRR